MKVSCTPNTVRARVRAGEGGVSHTRAAPTPIRANRALHTTGNTTLGGERGGFAVVLA